MPTYVSSTYTKSLLHFNGADASTTITDEKGIVWTKNGNVQLDTAQKYFGSASLLLDGAGDWLYNSAVFGPGAGSFCVDCWIKRAATGVVDTLFESRSAPTATDGFSLSIQTTNKLTVYVYSSFRCTSSTSIDTNWHHIACIGNGSTVKIYIDGVLEDTWTSAYNFSNDGAYWGRNSNNTTFLDGWIDEARITVGDTCWTGAFTPYSSEYELMATAQNYLIHRGRSRLRTRPVSGYGD